MTREVHLLLMRHGQIVQSPGPRRFVGCRDLPLDAVGQAQAKAAGSALAQLAQAGLPLRRISCSDLARSADTAQFAAEALNPRPEITPLSALREICLGQWQGLSAEEVRQRFPGQLERRGEDMADCRPAEGENFADLLGRVQPAIEGIIGDTAAAGERSVLVVAHAGVNRALLCQALGLPLQHVLRLPQDYACLNLLVWREGGLAVRAVNLAPGALAPGWAAAYGLGWEA